MSIIYVCDFPVCDTFDEVLTLPDSTPFAACLESGRQCMYFPVPDSNPRTWTRWAGKITSIDHGSALDMSSGVLTIQSATKNLSGTMSIQQVVDLLTVQSDLQDLTRNFNLILQFLVLTFNACPPGLEPQLEDALSAI